MSATSTLPGDNSETTIRARAVVNAAGPWVDEVCGLEAPQPPRLALSRGVHLVFNHADVPVRNTVVMPHAGRAQNFLPSPWGNIPTLEPPTTITRSLSTGRR